MLIENNILLAKIESPYGSDPTPTTTSNFLACHNVRINPTLGYNDTAATDGSLSPRAGTLGRKYIEVSFDHELQVNDSVQTTPPCKDILKACGYAESSGVYTQRTTSFDSVTIWVYMEDVLQKVSGCRGNVVWNLVAGQPAILAFTMQGLYQKPSDSTFPTSWTDSGGAPLVAINQSFDYDTAHPVIENLSFSLNNALSQNPTMDDAQAHGINEIVITNRMPECSFDAEMPLATSYDYWTVYEAVQQKAVGYVLSNGTAKCTISLPKVEITNMVPGDRGGTRTYNITGRPCRTTGDDEISLTFAAVV